MVVLEFKVAGGAADVKPTVAELRGGIAGRETIPVHPALNAIFPSRAHSAIEISILANPTEPVDSKRETF